MKKSFIFNLSILFVLNIIVKPFWLWLDMKVQTETGDEYGLYFALLNLSAILNVFLDLGVNNYNNRKIAANPSKFAKYFESISIIRMVLGLCFMMVLLSVGYILEYSSEELSLLFILGINQVLLSSILYVRSNLTGLGFFKTDSFISVLDRVLMITGVGLLLSGWVSGGISIEKFIWIQFYGYSITLVISLIVLMVVGSFVLPRFNKRFSKVLLRKSAPYALIVLLMSAYQLSDSIMIERLLPNGKEENSIYAQSFRILTALNNYAYLFAVLLLPMFSKMLKLKERVSGLLSLGGGVLIYGVSGFCLLMFFYGYDVITACYGVFPEKENYFSSDEILNLGQINTSVKVFSLLIFSIIPMSVNYSYGALITASGNMSFLNKTASISLVLNVILNFVLIPMHGAYGAAFSSLITQSFSAVCQVVYTYRHFEIKLSLLKPLRFIAGLVFFWLVIDWLDYQFQLGFRLLLIAVFVLFGLVISVRFEGLKSLISRVKK